MQRSSQSQGYIENLGQWDAQARFLSRTAGLNVWLTDRGVVYDLHRIKGTGKSDLHGSNQRSIKGHVVRMEFAGSATAELKGWSVVPGEYNYLRGSKPENWTQHVRSYGEARSGDLYPGITARWYFESNKPRYDLIVAPGSDPRQIAMKFAGADSVSSDGTTLKIGTSMGALEHRGLLAYQGVGANSRQVPCRIVAEGNTVRFDVGAYDPLQPLVIDPLIWTSFLGGGSDDKGHVVEVDANGNPIIAGETASSGFPVSAGAYEGSFTGMVDGFVTKLSADGTTLLFSTFIGGDTEDRVRGMTLDSSGRIVICGNTNSANFPTTAGAFDTSFNGNYDAFVAKLSSDGSTLLWSTYAGGSNSDSARSVCMDSSGRPVVAGYTDSSGFPTTAGAFDTTFGGIRDGYLLKLTSGGAGLVYSSFLGADGFDLIFSVALDSSDRAVVAGSTDSATFPTKAGSYDTTHNGEEDAFITKFNNVGTGLVFSTFLGGSTYEQARAVVLDANENPVFVGQTDSTGFPTTAGVLDTTYNGNLDAYLAKLSVNGSALVYSTFLGGQNTDEAIGVLVDSNGRAVVCGQTGSSDFPTRKGSYDITFNGGEDAFLMKVNPTASGLVYGTFFGGFSEDAGFDVAADQHERVFLSGGSDSGDFPTTAGAYDSTLGGFADAIVALFAPGIMNAVADSYSVKANEVLTVTAPGVLQNDAYPEGGVALISQSPTHASTMSLNLDGSFSYTPIQGFIGTDFFKYRIQAGGSQTTAVKVTITVKAVLSSVSNLNNPVKGGTPLTGTVTLVGPAPAGGVTVYFSDNLGVLQSEGYTVTVPQGATSVGFSIGTLMVANQQNGTLTVSLQNGTANKSKGVTIVP